MSGRQSHSRDWIFADTELVSAPSDQKAVQK